MDLVSLSHHTVVEIAAKIHEPSMQFPQYKCRVLYPRVSRLYETDDRPKKSARNISRTGTKFYVGKNILAVTVLVNDKYFKMHEVAKLKHCKRTKLRLLTFYC
jgi:hypothetical protein